MDMLWYSSGPLAGCIPAALAHLPNVEKPHEHAADAQYRRPRRASRGRPDRAQPRPGAVASSMQAKGRNDFVTEIDRMAERDIIETVRRVHPDHGFLGEETGRSGGDEFVWIIDPLDGTTNFLHGFPVFAVSIAVEHRGRLEHAVVYDPMRQELFTASRGGGAQVDGRRIRVSKQTTLEGALVGHRLPAARQLALARRLHGDAQGHDADRPPACAARAPPRSTSPTSRRAASTASGKSA